jgi:hypothetical protein
LVNQVNLVNLTLAGTAGCCLTTLAALVHADISGVLSQLQQLAALLGQAVRQPDSRELKAQLQRKVRGKCPALAVIQGVPAE